MPPKSKRWKILPTIPPDHGARYAHLHPLLAQALYNRGVTAADDIAAFLQGTVRFDDPSRLRGVPEAAERIRAAIRRGEGLVVYGDFDADGVTATALMVQVLRALGARVSPYIPHRVDEGYGLNCQAIDKIAAGGNRLVVTVDCGIRSLDEVRHANELGLHMIVTDHHAIRRGRDGEQELPPALAVVNPRQDEETYPFHELAGVGIAFKLAQALLMAERESPVASQPVQLADADLIDLVALGTVADLASLLGENRALVKRGLAALNRPQRPGVQAMLEEAKLAPGRIDAGTIGFVLGPRLNAAGRLRTAEISYGLLMAQDIWEAVPLANQLAQLNRERQDLTQRLVTTAREQIEREGADRFLFLVQGKHYNPGVVGLVASRLTEELYRPTLVAEQGSATTHGSARSIPEFDITAALDECRDLILRYGGHAMAAGFTVANERLPELQARLESIAARQLADRELVPALEIDAETSLSGLDWATQEMLGKLEPCGAANAQPVLASLGLEVVASRLVGQDGQHLKLSVRDGQAVGAQRALVWDAIAFRQGAWAAELPRRVDLAYTLECNEFNGERRLQLNVKDIRPAEA